MKKKILSMVLAAAMVFSITGCSNKSSNSTAPTEAPAQAETEAPANDAGASEDAEQTEAPAQNDGEAASRLENKTPSGQLVIGETTETSGDYTPWWTNQSADYDVFKMVMMGAEPSEITQEGTYAINENLFQSVEETENEDGSKTWTFTQQPGLKWSNGDPLTAKDYAFAYLFTTSKVLNIDLEANSAMFQGQYIKGFKEWYAGETDVLSGVRLLGEDKFSVTVDAEYMPYYYGITMTNVSPLYMKGWVPEGIDVVDTEEGVKFTGDFTAANIKDTVTRERFNPTACSGPYILEKYDTGAYSYTLKANPNYQGNYEGKKPNIETLILRYVSQDTMMDELKTGGIDLLYNVMEGAPIDAGLDMVDEGGYGYIDYPRDGYGRLVFKCNVGPTQFVEVRQAIAYLLDRNEFAKAFTGGHGSVVNSNYGESQWMVEEAEDQIATLNPYNYSPDEAIKLLEQGGWTKDANGNDYSGTGIRYKEVDGELMPLEIEWCSSENNSVSDMLVTKLVKNPDLEKAGMKINQHIVNFSELSESYNFDKGGYHMFNLGLGFSVPYDVKEDYAIDGAYNFARINDEKLSAYAVEMNQVPEGDDEQYLGKWFAFIQRWNELLPELPLYSNNIHDFFSDKLKGYEKTTAIWDMPREIIYSYIEE